MESISISETPPKKPAEPLKPKKGVIALLIILVLIFVLTAGGLGYLYWQKNNNYKKLNQDKQTQIDNLNQDKTTNKINKVSGLAIDLTTHILGQKNNQVIAIHKFLFVTSYITIAAATVANIFIINPALINPSGSINLMNVGYNGKCAG